VESKKYLKNWQKLAYGSGDMGSNFMYAFVTSFLMIYLTDSVGMSAGIVGTLMMASKLLDGVSDVFFGGLLDNTNSKMGKARPWLFWTTFPLAICEILLFMIPGTGEAMQYAYFFVVYTLLNAVFYTANNISYGSLAALMTKNPNERVQAGSIRFMFAGVSALTVMFATTKMVGAFGGDSGNLLAGWRNTAIVFALLLIIFNMVCVLSVKELPQDEPAGGARPEKLSFVKRLRLLLRNKYYLLILSYYIISYTVSGATSGVGIYFCTYVLGNPSLLGILSAALLAPAVIGLSITPFLVKRFGMYKVNLAGAAISMAFSIPVVIFGYMGNLPLLIAFQTLKALGSTPMIGTLSAVIADAAHYSFLKDKVRLEGSMYSCSSMGVKLGSGIGSALCGLLLSLGGYNGLAQTQTAGAIGMISFIYLAVPAIPTILTVAIVASLNIRKAIRAYEPAEAALEGNA
jgi:GPH family glycoside/pentoside/hexuronide:cation symporter